jgi:Flp pilus assembly protein TadG
MSIFLDRMQSMRAPPPRAETSPRRGPLALLRRTAGSRRGASAAEFAIIAGPLFLLILGTCEAAWQLVTGAALDHAALRASRYGATGADSIPSWQRGGTAPQDMPTCRSAGITWMVSASTAGLIRQGQNLTVTTATWSNLGTVAGTGTQNAGEGGQITSYTIRYLQPFITGPVAASFWGGPGFVHQTTIVIKNEPFENTPC